MLCSLPDLAPCVHSLYAGMGQYRDRDLYSPMEWASYSNPWRTHPEDGDAERPHSPTEDGEYDNVEKALAALAIAQACNIKRLAIAELHRLFPFYRQGSLPCLTGMGFSSNVT